MTVNDICPYRYPHDPRFLEPHVVKAIWWGMGGSVVIALVLYLVQAVSMGDVALPAEFMRAQWYYVLPLIIGFGLQTALFGAMRARARRGGGALAASGGVSTTSMLACCTHNLVPLIPVLGVSGMAAFLAEHQGHIFQLSILFVTIGTAYMWRTYSRLHACCTEQADMVA